MFRSYEYKYLYKKNEIVYKKYFICSFVDKLAARANHGVFILFNDFFLFHFENIFLSGFEYKIFGALAWRIFDKSAHNGENSVLLISLVMFSVTTCYQTR